MAELPFKNWFRRGERGVFPFRHRAPRAPGVLTALDVDGLTLRLVQATPRGGQTSIARVMAAPLDLAPDADRSDPALLGSAIARALHDAGIRPGSVVMGVPRAQVVLRTLVLPFVADTRQLASMVHFQLGRDLPFRMEEAVVDFKVRRQVTAPVLRADASAAGEVKTEPVSTQRLEVLVAAVKQEVVEFYQQLAEAAGFKLAALGLLSYANARCVEACRVAEGGQAFALVSLRPDEVSIDVIAEQFLLFSRGAAVKPSGESSPPPPSAPFPSADPAAASDAATALAPPASEPSRSEPFVELVTIEVVRSLHSYSGMESDNPATKIVVTGASGQEAAVVEALGRRLGRPCTLLDPASALGIPDEARGQTSGAIGAIGLALGLGDAAGLPFNFLNPKRPAVQRDLRRLRLLMGAAATAAVVVFALALKSSLMKQRVRIHQQAAAELADAEKSRPIYRRTLQQSAAIDDWLRSSLRWLDHYAYLSAILPPSEEVYLSSLSVNGNGAIRLAVQARSGEILAKLEKQLRTAGYDVKPLAITPGADPYGYEFRSNIELAVPEKLRIDLTKIKFPPRPADDASLESKSSRAGGGG